MNFAAFTGATEAEGIAVLRMDNSPIGGIDTDGGGLWHLSGSSAGASHYPWSDGRIYTAFFRSTRTNSTLTRSPTNTLYIINERSSSSGGNSFVNQTSFVTAGGSFAVPNDPAFLAGRANSIDVLRMRGTVPGMALNLIFYTVNQRNAVHEFCKAYYGVTY
jgi:hypothetical protein